MSNSTYALLTNNEDTFFGIFTAHIIYYEPRFDEYHKIQFFQGFPRYGFPYARFVPTFPFLDTEKQHIIATAINQYFLSGELPLLAKFVKALYGEDLIFGNAHTIKSFPILSGIPIDRMLALSFGVRAFHIVVNPD